MFLHASSLSIMKQKLSISTPFFGIPLWVLLVASTAAFIVVACIIMCVCYIFYPRPKSYKTRFYLPKSMACKHYRGDFSSSSLDRRLLSASSNISELEINSGYHEVSVITKDGFLKGDLESSGELSSVAKDVRKGCCFSLKEIEYATNGLAKENVIGSRDNGIVYRGLLPDNKKVAVKRLVCHSCQPEEYFAAQMEAIGRAKHKNLVKLLGHCTEGPYRMPVSEYVENGNLHYWLHEVPGQVSLLTWTIRLNIIHGVAKGLAYLHEIEPKNFHGSIKSSNILLDLQWNPKISDFGLAKPLNLEWSEALGHVAPDCHSTSALTEGNDIHDFGLLIMEIISGWNPSDYGQPQTLIEDWFKSIISNGKIACVVDPKLPEMLLPRNSKDSFWLL